MATGAIYNFSTVSFMEFYNVTLTTAATALSAYLICSACGMLLGGVIADRTRQHARVAAIGLGLAACFALIVASGLLPFAAVMLVLAITGLCQGVTTPSRDILVKTAAPPGSIGRVFGIVYSGGDAALAIAPVAFGILADHHAYHAIFIGVAILYLIGIATVLNLGAKRD
jgi:MFS family permease